MIIKGAIEIEKPRVEVVRFFADPKYLVEYQDGFIKKDLISGDEGQSGALSKLYYQHGNQQMELTERVTANQLPDSFEASYYHKHMDNTMKCTFTAIDENRTRYEYEFEYTRIDWVMPKLMALLFPGLYRKPAAKWIRQFKTFVERQ